MPVVLIFTKLDDIVTKFLRDIHGSDSQQLARDKALEVYRGSCRRLFDKDPSEVPAGVFSGIFISHMLGSCTTDITNHP